MSLARVFPNDELTYYAFGLRAGFRNLSANGLRLGLKKSLGKISQPVNAPSRFPEYHHFATAIREYLSGVSERQPSILDVGSPKLLGLYLGYTTRTRLTLTDISDLNIEEYRVMWRALERDARGRIDFALQDARALQLPDAAFDVVYSMSVLEHVEGAAADRDALRELLRVLKPGGMLVVSVPFGRVYMEQWRIGMAGAVRSTGDAERYFFQRIYDAREFQTRLLALLASLAHVQVITVTRRHAWLMRGFGALGENVRGVFGFVNPMLSALVNRTRGGIDDSFAVRYGPLHRASDVYGDLILIARKP